MQRLLSLSVLLFLSLFARATNAEFLKGLPVADGDYPEFIVTQSGNLRCNGVLIGPKAIALAAHCISERSPLIRFQYKKRDYSAISLESETYSSRKHDLAVAIIIGHLPDAEPASISVKPITEDLVVRLFSYGCDAAGEINTDFETLRMGDTSIASIEELFYSVKNPSYTTECFKNLGGPAVIYSNDNRFIVGISPNDRDLGTHSLVRFDSRDSLELWKRAHTKYGLKICGYNLVCHY